MKSLKTLLFAMLSLFMISCGKDNNDLDLNSPLTISVSKDIIQTDGKDYAEVTVKLNEEVINEELAFYFKEGKVLKPATKYVTDSRFSIDKAGTYHLMARYGTFSTVPVTIHAIPVAVPDTPADPIESSVDFKTRALLIQFTGVACGMCPRAKTIMKDIGEGKTSVSPDSYVKIECHNYSGNGYIDKAEFDTELSTLYCAGYPNLNANFHSVSNGLGTEVNVEEYISSVLSLMSPKAGLALNFSVLERQAILKVTVKAGVTSEFRVGGVLLEDGIVSQQLSATADWMHTHNACIRWMDAGKNYTGVTLEEMIKGEEKSYVFIWDLDAIENDRKANPGVDYWDGINPDNLRAAAYVTMPSPSGKMGYIVVNAVQTTSNNQAIPYEYNERD